LHHVHNAEFLHYYPGMPAWLSPAWVYGAWVTMTTLGVTGYVLFMRGRSVAGLVLLAAYGCYGLDVLVHYALAPLGAHTPAMNASIWLEAGTAIALLAATISQARAAALR
jgi:hypothetical protein